MKTPLSYTVPAQGATVSFKISTPLTDEAAQWIRDFHKNALRYYRCHPNRFYHVLVHRPTGRLYKSRAGRIRWKHRDARWVREHHNLGPNWDICIDREGVRVREYRQAKKAPD